MEKLNAMHVAGNTEHRVKIEHLDGADESEAMCAISVARHVSTTMIGIAPMTK
jgi:hypothetical protein